MSFMKNRLIVTALILGMTIPSVGYTTNGAWLIGFGSKSRSMGGTGVAYNMGGMAAAFNPATMIDSGSRFEIGAELFIPPRAITHESSVLGFTDEESNENLFLVPSMGGTWQWKENTVLGFAFIGAGLKTEYNQTVNSDSCQRVNSGQIPGYTQCPPTVFDPNITIQPATEAGVQLMQMQFIPSIAYEVNKTHTIGGSVVIAGQFFRAEGLEAFEDLGFTASSGNLTGEGWDSSFGAGLRLGWLGKFYEDRFRVGVNYSSRVYMTEFDKYKNAFAEQGDFDIPSSYAIGIAFNATPDIAIAFDIQRINWSEVASIGNPGPAVTAPITGNLFELCPGPNKDPCKLGGDLGLGFGWTDQTVFKIGMDWIINQKWNFRAGWNYGEAPIPEDQVLFNFLAPATPEHHLTLGGGYKFKENLVLDMNVMIAFLNTIKGPTAFGPGGAFVADSNASIAMGQYSLGGTLGWKF